MAKLIVLHFYLVSISICLLDAHDTQKLVFCVKKSRLQVRKNDFLLRTVVSANALDCVDFFDRGLTKRGISSALSV